MQSMAASEDITQLGFPVSEDLLVTFLSQWLDVTSLVALDRAITNQSIRLYWKSLLPSVRSSSLDNWNHNDASLRWLAVRRVCVRRIFAESKPFLKGKQ